jgi:hypothetical protein
MKHPALAAYLHFFLPRWLQLSLTNGAVDEPAEVPELEFPGRAVFPRISRAVLNGPASPVFLVLPQLPAEKKQDLSFYMRGNSSPALLKALYGFDRGSQQVGHLALGFSQLMTDLRELRFFHKYPPFSGFCSVLS